MQKTGDAKPLVIGNAPSCGAVIAVAALAAGTLDQPFGIRQDLFGHTRRDRTLAHLGDDRIPFMSGQGNQPKRDTITIQNIDTFLG